MSSIEANFNLPELRELRDSIFQQYSERNKQLGRIASQAIWETEEHGIARLSKDLQGRFSSRICRPTSTQLRFQTPINQSYSIPDRYSRLGGREIVYFDMIMDGEGMSEVYRWMDYPHDESAPSMLGYFLNRRTERQLGLQVPTISDIEYVFTELGRGASGHYFITPVLNRGSERPLD